MFSGTTLGHSYFITERFGTLGYKLVEYGSISDFFFYYLQEENVLGRFEKIEELFLLERMVEDSSGIDSKDLRIEIHKETIQLVEMYNEDCIKIISHLLKNLIGFSFISAYLILGKNKLGILNSWIQEFFYSLSDTMKYFLILLAIDLCIGFHSPHGWELMIDSISKNFGFAHNE
jgi:hypothetical protein